MLPYYLDRYLAWLLAGTASAVPVSAKPIRTASSDVHPNRRLLATIRSSVATAGQTLKPTDSAAYESPSMSKEDPRPMQQRRIWTHNCRARGPSPQAVLVYTACVIAVGGHHRAQDQTPSDSCLDYMSYSLDRFVERVCEAG